MQPSNRRRAPARTAVPSADKPASTTLSEVGERWSESFVFVLAASGAAIGFNNLWQFPWLASQGGGGAFVLIYLLLAVTVGVPLLISEVMLGRLARGSPVTAMRELGRRGPGGRHWGIAGALAVLGGFLIFTYLAVIAGWALGYFVRALTGTLAGLTADGLGSLFTALVKDPEKQLFWHALFVAVTLWIAGGGVRRGLEPAVKVLVPLLFLSLFVLMAYSIVLGGFEEASRFLFLPDFSQLSLGVWLAALGHLFFSLGLGMGMMMMYGAYLKADASVPRVTLTVVGLDVFTAVVGGLVVFGVLFAGGVEPASGPALFFQSVPLAFDHLPYGRWFAGLFFALIVVVALLTAIALVEPVLVWLHERFGLRRSRAALISGVAAWAVGLAVLLSFNYWAFSFNFFGVEKQLGLFDLLQIVTAHILLPLSGVLIAVFAGWMLAPDISREELRMRSPCLFDAWLWLLRVVVPLALLVLFVNLPKLYA